MAKNRKFVKCGIKALSFACPYSGFNVSRGQVKELTTIEQRRSNKIKAALRGGHLEKATEAEHEAYLESLNPTKDKKKKDAAPEPTLKEELMEKTKADLTEYYKSNYEVSDDDVKGFEKLNHDDMVEELIELAEED